MTDRKPQPFRHARLALAAFLCAPVAAMADARHALGEDLHWVFVGFIYAFVVTEAVKRIARIVISQDRRHSIPRLAHLLLALVNAVMGWIGWSLSTRYGAYPEINGVFEVSTPFFFADLTILMGYYGLILAADSHAAGDPRLPSVKQVLGWSSVIYVAYVAWDAFSWMAHSKQPNVFSAYGWAVSTVAAAWAIASLVLLRRIDRHLTASLVWMTDVSLIGLSVWFRAFKNMMSRGGAAQDKLAYIADFASIVFVICLLAAWRRASKVPSPSPHVAPQAEDRGE